MKSLPGSQGQVSTGALLLACPMVPRKLSYALKRVLITAESGEERYLSLLREFRKVCSRTRSQVLYSLRLLSEAQRAAGQGNSGVWKRLACRAEQIYCLPVTSCSSQHPHDINSNEASQFKVFIYF